MPRMWGAWCGAVARARACTSPPNRRSSWRPRIENTRRHCRQEGHGQTRATARRRARAEPHRTRSGDAADVESAPEARCRAEKSRRRDWRAWRVGRQRGSLAGWGDADRGEPASPAPLGCSQGTAVPNRVGGRHDARAGPATLYARDRGAPGTTGGEVRRREPAPEPTRKLSGR